MTYHTGPLPRTWLALYDSARLSLRSHLLNGIISSNCLLFQSLVLGRTRSSKSAFQSVDSKTAHKFILLPFDNASFQLLDAFSLFAVIDRGNIFQ